MLLNLTKNHLMQQTIRAEGDPSIFMRFIHPSLKAASGAERNTWPGWRRKVPRPLGTVLAGK